MGHRPELALDTVLRLQSAFGLCSMELLLGGIEATPSQELIERATRSADEDRQPKAG
jgi:hypothetical protein